MIEIVTHAYSKTLPQYAVFLRAQLTSIVADAEDAEVRVTVCYTPGDERVEQVLDDFIHLPGMSLHPLPQEPQALFRRCIGRNLAALRSPADLVWFCDADYVFGPDCLSHLWRVWTGYCTIQPPVMLYPSEVMIHTTHEIGDAFWNKHLGSRSLITPDPKDFTLKRYWKAIGGAQIVDGDFCRTRGYLGDFSNWQRPLRESDTPFHTTDDKFFRRVVSRFGRTEPVELPHLYRLRHSLVSYR